MLAYDEILAIYKADPRNELRVVATSNDDRYVARLNDHGELRVVTDDQAAKAMLRFGRTLNKGLRSFLFRLSHAKEFLQFWLSEAKAILDTDVPRLALHGDCASDDITWCKVDLKRDLTITKDDLSKCPTWMEVVGRMDLPEEFMLWTGGLFLCSADISQYFWLYGEGNDSKSSIVRVFKELLGDTFRTSSSLNEKVNGRFWLENKMDANLIVFNDVNNPSLVQNEIIKGITGGDTMDIERKGTSALTKKLNCKVLMTANKKPKIKLRESDLRRALFCGISKYEKPEGTEDISEAEVTGLFMSEARVFINYCANYYTEVLGGKNKIPEPDNARELALMKDGDLEDAIERHLIVGQNLIMLAEDMQEFKTRLRKLGLYSKGNAEFVKDYLWNHHLIDSDARVISIDGDARRFYRGAQLKTWNAEGHTGKRPLNYEEKIAMTKILATERGITVV